MWRYPWRIKFLLPMLIWTTRKYLKRCGNDVAVTRKKKIWFSGLIFGRRKYCRVSCHLYVQTSCDWLCYNMTLPFSYHVPVSNRKASGREQFVFWTKLDNTCKIYIESKIDFHVYLTYRKIKDESRGKHFSWKHWHKKVRK